MRVFTVFFSALAGFGLKRLADRSDVWPSWETWACFMAGLFLLLRFLFGSANHLWLDFIGDPPRQKGNPGREMRWAMLLDCLFLVVIGTVALIMCYRPDVRSFMEWNSWLGFVAVGVVVVDFTFRRFSGENARKFGFVWLPLNFAYAILAGYIAWLYGEEPGWWWPFVLALVSMACFLIDLGFQIYCLDGTDYEDKSPGGWKDKRYEQSIRVPTVFFSMLMGFGLKRLADTWEISCLHLACFIIALSLFLRILFGSANSLWLAFVKHPPAGWKPGLALLWDCFCLTLMGLAGVILCYSKSILFFTFWSAGLAFGIAFIDSFDATIRKPLPCNKGADIRAGWILINLIHALVGGLIGLALLQGWLPSEGNLVTGLFVSYAVIGVTLLLWDLGKQLLALNE